jgi:hypothetical protein
MRKPWGTLACALALVCVAAANVSPYSHYYTDGSAPTVMSWHRRLIRVRLSTSLRKPPPNIKEGGDVEGAALRSLRRWEEAAGIRFAAEWTDEQSASAGERGDGVSLITVADTRDNGSLFAGETIGYTKLFYNLRTGEIFEGDIAVSPRQKFSTDGSPGTYDLEATLTHEVGHLLGLDHSEARGAVMHEEQLINGPSRPQTSTGRTLSADDRAGIQALYGPPQEARLS